jgi:hypothetical protein
VYLKSSRVSILVSTTLSLFLSSLLFLSFRLAQAAGRPFSLFYSAFHRNSAPSTFNMFTSSLVTLAFVFVFAIVNVVALPVPEPAHVRLGHALAQRDPAPFEPILAYMKRDGVWDTDLGKRDSIPAEVAVKAPNGQVELFPRDSIPAEIAVKAPNGQVELFVGRDSIPAEVAV